MITNRLPKYWVVENDKSQLFLDTVIKYMNVIDQPQSTPWYGTAFKYYGYDGNELDGGTRGADDLKSFTNLVTLLTLQQFIEMTIEQPWVPKRGEVVLVRNYETDSWKERIYLTTISGSSTPYVCVMDSYTSIYPQEGFTLMNWQKMKQKIDEIKISITVNGKEISPSAISEETWNNLRTK
jgi:hypothetical protein